MILNSYKHHLCKCTCLNGISSLVPKGRDLYAGEGLDSCACSHLRRHILHHHTAVPRRSNIICTWDCSWIPKPQVYISHGSTGQLFPMLGQPVLTGVSWAYWVMAVQNIPRQVWAVPFLSFLKLHQNQAVALWWWREKLIYFLSSSYFRLKANMNSVWQQVTVSLVFLDIGEIWSLFLTISSGHIVQLQDEWVHCVLHKELA